VFLGLKLPASLAVKNFEYSLEFKVRDYECDLQGFVNNSVYQNYLEHARHEFLLSKGLNFAALAAEGVFLVVTRIELDYKLPLKSGDIFWIGINHSPKGILRGIFEQKIYRKEDDRLVLNGLCTWAAINSQGKPIKAQFLIDKLSDPLITPSR
jgi:acyl-CoA thioester hydrolase